MSVSRGNKTSFILGFIFIKSQMFFLLARVDMKKMSFVSTYLTLCIVHTTVGINYVLVMLVTKIEEFL